MTVTKHGLSEHRAQPSWVSTGAERLWRWGRPSGWPGGSGVTN